MVLAALTRRPWLAFPAAAALAASGVVLLRTQRIAKRRKAAREAALDEQVAASFPASDPPAHR